MLKELAPCKLGMTFIMAWAEEDTIAIDSIFGDTEDSREQMFARFHPSRFNQLLDDGEITKQEVDVANTVITLISTSEKVQPLVEDEDLTGTLSWIGGRAVCACACASARSVDYAVDLCVVVFYTGCNVGRSETSGPRSLFWGQ